MCVERDYADDTRARFLSVAPSKLRLCSANHRPGYWSNPPCDWSSTAWAYSEQEAENGPRSIKQHVAVTAWTHLPKNKGSLCVKLTGWRIVRLWCNQWVDSCHVYGVGLHSAVRVIIFVLHTSHDWILISNRGKVNISYNYICFHTFDTRML